MERARLRRKRKDDLPLRIYVLGLRLDRHDLPAGIGLRKRPGVVYRWIVPNEMALFIDQHMPLSGDPWYSGRMQARGVSVLTERFNTPQECVRPFESMLREVCHAAKTLMEWSSMDGLEESREDGR